MRKFVKMPVEVGVLTYEEVRALFGSEELVDGDVARFDTHGGRHLIHYDSEGINIPTEEGVMRMTEKDVMIIGVDGEIYPCKIDIFEKTYNEAIEAKNFTEDTLGVGVRAADSNLPIIFGFGSAIKALKRGRRICREGWNGKGLYVFMQVPSDVPVIYAEKMSSLPQAVKDDFISRGQSSDMEHQLLKYSNQMCIVKPNNEINSWVPSSSDIFAEDWIILD